MSPPNAPPRWYMPVAVVALLWNLIGCAAYLSDVMLTPDDIARMSAEQQALYASRPAWAVAATAVAVWGGAAGSLALILRRRSAIWLLMASLVGVIVQDFGLFVLAGGTSLAGPAAMAIQGVVLLIAVALVLLARKAAARNWLIGEGDFRTGS